MGNHRFRFSDMIPNAWFYKLKDMGKTRKQSSATSTLQTSHVSQPRNSYHFSRARTDRICRSPINTKALDANYPDPPRVSSRKKPKRRTIYRPSPKLVSTWSNSNFSSSLETSPELKADFHDHESLVSETDFQVLAAPDSFCECEVTSDIIIDVNNTESFTGKFEKLDGFNSIYELQLPPILTKPRKFDQVTNAGTRSSDSEMEELEASRSLSVKKVKRERIRAQNEPKPRLQMRKSSAGGIRLRSNTPKMSRKKIPRKSVCVSSSPRSRSLGESFAVVKSSVDPQRDFRESMVEMIVENNLRTTKHLEELLACYLSLNSKEYHHLIVKAFEEIWLEMTDLLHLPMM
ncbi:transcription repressor OFP4 [Tripterygium wilfordii]|uniref:Transcription repressor n=1 Tax=Tripterygium wilfordii TaxID=458696 RepID=A0A7J7DDL2_TRIWF|nr:transcription repressor OFP3 [Tripterygium wilfordii]KAF5744450.1 transcription repressor OFP4 [Tripterygium wilfordii]